MRLCYVLPSVILSCLPFCASASSSIHKLIFYSVRIASTLPPPFSSRIVGFWCTKFIMGEQLCHHPYIPHPYTSPIYVVSRKANLGRCSALRSYLHTTTSLSDGTPKVLSQALVICITTGLAGTKILRHENRGRIRHEVDRSHSEEQLLLRLLNDIPIVPKLTCCTVQQLFSCGVIFILARRIRIVNILRAYSRNPYEFLGLGIVSTFYIS
jgi:hypothetical protein